jgi:hypothetical protein
MAFGSPGPFPIPSVTVITSGGAEVGGPQYLKFHQYQPSYADVIDEHVYEDGGVSYVLANDTAPIVFLFEYDGLLEAEAATLDNHRSDAFGPAFPFELTNPRTGQVFQGVRYLEWDEDHRLYQTINSRVVRLVWRPV